MSLALRPEIHWMRPLPRDRNSIDHGRSSNRSMKCDVTSGRCIVGLTISWPRVVVSQWWPRRPPSARHRRVALFTQSGLWWRARRCLVDRRRWARCIIMPCLLAVFADATDVHQSQSTSPLRRSPLSAAVAFSSSDTQTFSFSCLLSRRGCICFWSHVCYHCNTTGNGCSNRRVKLSAWMGNGSAIIPLNSPGGSTV